MVYNQKKAWANILFVFFVLASYYCIVMITGWQRFSRSMTDIGAVYLVLILGTFQLGNQIQYRFSHRMNKLREFDERDYAIGREAIQVVYIAFWLLALTICATVAVLYHRQPQTEIPVYILPLMLGALALLLTLVHSISILIFYGWKKLSAED
ncbi:MAG: hypothetical protein A3F83_12520 [Candidatus Glassbacteria bacterium RIFCSPLOWO2_12_FULL_58_11]|uniref:Uncharacterized protein n=1 Tax=Candidatus Glassbacteria bacterium RIFCSPLOWO2_12_FULL_58_11 TaxID=1817867 RepID=A0A1F5YMR7_9BACT|nr:MAG: hypothetical protein A3F83_12520 [Candidatus Glassbacteria bacterium RIFCSPLOWO2_12_FULL_58_11]